MIPLSHILIFAGGLFAIGLAIAITKKNAVMVLIGIELMLNASNVNLVAFNAYDTHGHGQVFSLFVILVAAAEVAVALAIVLQVYRHHDTTNVNQINEIKP